jgi:TatA/E family protein of Tat protein translocase
MGPLGWQETVFIFFLALLLFGPKKLPELGRTIGKAMTEFRRASNELKATFDREMKSLEQQTDFKELKEVAAQYQYDTYNYDYSSYEGSNYEGSYGTESYDSTASTPSIASASAPEGAESPSVVEPAGETAAAIKPGGEIREETVPRGEFGAAAPDGHAEASPVTPAQNA